MLLAYTLPWVSGGSTSLSFGAYDLAEWTSLHPSVRGTSPLMLPPLALRLPLVCIGLLIAFSPLPRAPRALALLVIVGALLPAAEFFTSARDDVNYQQQFGLALVALAGGAVGISDRIKWAHAWIILGVAVVGAAASLYGQAQGYDLLRGFNLPVYTSAAGIILAAIFGLWVVAVVWEKKTR
jgi:hypothetical protein